MNRSFILNASSFSQATVKMEGGKVVADFPNYHQTSEIVGDKLVEVSVQRVSCYFILERHFMRSRDGMWLA